MAEKDYTKTVYVDGSEPDVDAVHLNNTEDGLDELYHPKFDDSGIVEGIASFPAFLSTVVNKMNPIAFYKNFKAGMAFVLHAGQLVNNGLCNEPGKYPLDAAYGKTLRDDLDRTNSDLAWKSGENKTGSGAITLPANFSELNIRCYAQSGDYRYSVTYHFVRAELTAAGMFYCSGYNAAGEIAMFRIAVTPSTVTLVSAYLGDIDVVNSTTVAVYYR